MTDPSADPGDRFPEWMPSHANSQDLATLTEIYTAWCQNVTFDNALRWLEVRRHPDASHRGLPGQTTAHFWADHRRWGVGGLCMPTANALRDLLAVRGFDARNVLAKLDDAVEPDHITTIVRIGDDRYLLDTVAMNERPVPLLDDHDAGGPVHRVTVTRDAEVWCFTWTTPAMRSEQTCRLRLADIAKDPVAFYRTMQDTDVYARFNAGFYACGNTHDGGVAVVLGPFAVQVEPDGTTAESDTPEVVLRERLGWSNDIVAQLQSAGALG